MVQRNVITELVNTLSDAQYRLYSSLKTDIHMRILTGKHYSAAVDALFYKGNSDGSIRCAVAFWGKQAEKYIPYMSSRSKIICNLESGATNPNVIQTMRDNRIDVRTLEKLHAKVYLGNTSAIIGSANCSTNGLTLEEDSGWIEAGVSTSDEGIIDNLNDWFSVLWSNARKITDKDIEKAQITWNERRINRPKPKKEVLGKKASLLDIIKNKPELIIDRNIYLVITTSGLDEEAEDCAHEQGWNDYDIYQDWAGLPEDALLIDASLEGDKGTVNGLYRSTKPHSKATYTDTNTKTHEIIHVHEIAQFMGLKLTKNDKALLGKKLPEIWNRYAKQKDKISGGCAIRIDIAREAIFDKQTRWQPQRR